MIVVADTTPLNYLILIGEIDLLAALYRAVLIPQEVPSRTPAIRHTACSARLGDQPTHLVRSPLVRLYS